jgi:hypothetical protein
VCVVEPVKERGMQDYRLDEIEDPQRHAAAVDRLTGKQAGRKVDHSAVNSRDAMSMDADKRFA